MNRTIRRTLVVSTTALLLAPLAALQPVEVQEAQMAG